MKKNKSIKNRSIKNKSIKNKSIKNNNIKKRMYDIKFSKIPILNIKNGYKLYRQ